jgi:hypothetical protein
MSALWQGGEAAPFNALDRAFVAFLLGAAQRRAATCLAGCACQPSVWARPRLPWHLQLLQDNPAELLGWTAEALQTLPADLAAAASTLPWIQQDNSPLVQVGQRLYLRRPDSAEQTILQSLQQRSTQPVQSLPQLPQLLDALFPRLRADRDCRSAAQRL